MHSSTQYRMDAQPSLSSRDWSLAFSARTRSAVTTASSKDPKHIEPNEYVMDRTKDEITADEQHPLASSGTKHQVPTAPLVVTRTMFKRTVPVQYRDTNKRKNIPQLMPSSSKSFASTSNDMFWKKIPFAA